LGFAEARGIWYAQVIGRNQETPWSGGPITRTCLRYYLFSCILLYYIYSSYLISCILLFEYFYLFIQIFLDHVFDPYLFNLESMVWSIFVGIFGIQDWFAWTLPVCTISVELKYLCFCMCIYIILFCYIFIYFIPVATLRPVTSTHYRLQAQQCVSRWEQSGVVCVHNRMYFISLATITFIWKNRMYFAVTLTHDRFSRNLHSVSRTSSYSSQSS
jgi:hypothetical protein